VEKSINITYSECVSVALGICQAMRIRRTVLCVAQYIPTHISTLSHKRQGKGKQHFVKKMCVLIFYTNFA
jgi:hypothetical protein